ncbi:aldo/keto reductase [Pigmentiphaga aceris]|uniref:Aldo/keto reductase n=1 Tax=Pigmentiphaga aceris TaxID=1940612 RepID=A0A5C0B3R2_9BURK|nr:aldo/keto reductase [Pigmentiphaga aceris]QEI07431.1 aldo/keto reductase [Pigmentiphaga aceris]
MTFPTPDVHLNDGHRLPTLGFGTWRLNDDESCSSVQRALAAGYRLIDTATRYENEVGVGRGIEASGLPRTSIVVTTKLHDADHGYDAALRAFDASAARLGLDYVDLYLIHWPLAERDLYIDTWRAFIRLREEGRVRSIGVSNFEAPHLERLIAETDVAPAVNQIELHVDFSQPALRAFHARHGIVTQSWRPLGKGNLFDHPVVTALAQKHQRSPAQILLRWHVELGLVPIPKSGNPARIAENLDIFGFSLTSEDLRTLATLDGDHRQGEHPDRHLAF